MGQSLYGTIGVGVDLGWEEDRDPRVVEKYIKLSGSPFGVEDEEEDESYIDIIGFFLHRAGFPLKEHVKNRKYAQITDLDFDSLGFELKMYGYPDDKQVGWALILKDGLNMNIDSGIAVLSSEFFLMQNYQLPYLKTKTEELENIIHKAGCFSEKPEFGLIVTTYYG